MLVVDDARLFSIAPDRTLTQRLTALEEANRIRVGRADWKKAVKRGEADVRSVLLDPPPLFTTMKVLELLMAQRSLGKVKANKMLRVTGISPSKTVGGLTARQRNELAAFLYR